MIIPTHKIIHAAGTTVAEISGTFLTYSNVDSEDGFLIVTFPLDQCTAPRPGSCQPHHATAMTWTEPDLLHSVPGRVPSRDGRS